ncbi:flavodoxin FldA [Buchnera aphidicola]|uniref:Flavodoxin n=1 Tax=Buchnera aphidicola (Stegophylla sp.) TaxID=2315800 RepID=A0A4D6Y8S7_9GAMM|nr:flavodoxin FldA [Buchnera aphidicola (Stegophylla sp.)]QCI26366.1 flavodoxin FldA [Buchnera aphidicola (Stegophylla sp.)]
MEKIGIFFGSDTGNTEKIANMIYNIIGTKKAEIYDISTCSKKEITKFNILIFGIPTWYYGELQCDWDTFLPTLKKINFKNKIISLFGCGDQEDYSEYFCDAIGIIYNILKNQGATIIGKWPTTGYNFESSKALLNSKYFAGLVIDEDRQSSYSQYRVETWVTKILYKLKQIYTNNDI